MDSRDLQAAHEEAKMTEPVEHERLLHRALGAVTTVRSMARDTFGLVQHGASVNQPLSDYYRELDEAERGLRNALNALVMAARQRDADRAEREQAKGKR